jgi:AcrR family transcriptional regulator
VEQRTTRDSILQAAKALFSQKGFASTSVREICETVGITAPALYYHFGNKEGLFEAVVKDTLNLDEFYNLLQARVAAALDPWTQLQAYVRTYLTSYPTHLLNPGLHLGNSMQLEGVSLRQLGSGIAAIHSLAREIVQSGIKAGEFRPVDADTTAACIMGVIDSFVRGQVYLGVTYDPEQIAECIVDLLGDGLRKRPR